MYVLFDVLAGVVGSVKQNERAVEGAVVGRYFLFSSGTSQIQHTIRECTRRVCA